MNITTLRLRKTLVVLLAIALMLLPSLIAFADDETGVQGTPTPDPISTPQAEQPAESPTSEQTSDEPSDTPSEEPGESPSAPAPEQDPNAEDNSESPSPEESETPSPSNEQTSETTSPEESNTPPPAESPSDKPADTPPAEFASPEESETPSPEESPSENPSESPTAEEAPAAPQQSTEAPSENPPAEKETPPPSDDPNETPTSSPSGENEPVPQKNSEEPSVSPTDEEVPPENSDEPKESPTEEVEETATPTPEPPVERLMVESPDAAGTKTLYFSNVAGVSSYSYSYTYYFRVRVGFMRYETRSDSASGTIPGSGGSAEIKLSGLLTGKSTSVTVQVHTSPNYSFDEWNHLSPGNHNNNPVTFDYGIFSPNTMVPRLNYNPPTATLTFNGATGLDHYIYDGHNYTAGQSVTVVAGESVTVNAVAKEHFINNGWASHPSASSVSSNSVTFNMPSSNSSVEAAFEQNEYKLTFDNATGLGSYSYGGSSYSGGGTVWVVKGTTVTVSAKPAEHFINKGWEYAPSSSVPMSTSEVTFDMPESDSNVKARFEQNEYKLTFDSATGLGSYSYGGSSYSGGGSVWVVKGTTVTVSAKPAEHFINKGWEYAPSSSVPMSITEVTFDMPASDSNVKARFEQNEYQLTFNNAAGLGRYSYGGSSYSGGSSVWIVKGTSVSVQAIPADHYIFKSWVAHPPVDPSAPSSPGYITFNMPESSSTVEASFEQSEYPLDFRFATGLDFYSCTVDGTEQIISSAQTIYVAKGASVSVKAHAQDAYAIDGWNSPSGATGDTASFTMDGPKTADAKVKVDGYYLTLVDGFTVKNYTVQYSGKTLTVGFETILIPKNVSVTVTANGYDGWIFDFWGATGAPPVSSINGNTCTFTMDNNYFAKAHFEYASSAHLVVKYDSLLGTGSGSITVTYNGDTCTLAGPGSYETFKYDPNVATMTVTANVAANCGFVKWTNHGNVTTPTMTINIPTGQGAPSPATRAVAVESIYPLFTAISLKPEIEKLGSLTITKVDQDDNSLKLSGAVFTLSNSSGYSQQRTTSGSGVASWSSLPAGTYTLTENSAPAGYEAVQTSWTIVIGSSGTVAVDCVNPPPPTGNWDVTKTIANKATHCSLTVTKVNANGDTIAAYAEFELYLGNVLIGKKTGSTGVFTWDDLEQGEYILKEVSAPSGYYWDVQTHNVSLKPSESGWPKFSMNVKNLEYGKLIVYKIDQDENPLTGAAFTLDGVPGVETPAGSGTYVWEDLKPGTYTLNETGVPSGYYIEGSSSQSVTITAGNTTEVDVTNYKFVNIQVKKISNFTEGALAGAEFKIELNGVQIGATQTTNSSGVATFGDVYELKAGVTYTVTEVSPPQYYQNDSTPVNIKVNEPGGINSLSEAVFENTPILQKITVVKYIDSVDVASMNGLLDGTEFKLYKDGTYVESKYLVNGRCEFTGLLPGEYKVEEVAGSSTKFFIIAGAVTKTLSLVEEEGVNTNYEFTNTPGTADFSIRKTDAENTSLGLKDAIYHLSGMNWTGTGYVPVTYELRTNSSGYASVTGITAGVYTLKEITPPFGYELDPTVYTVEILPNNSVEYIYRVSDVEYDRGRLTIAKFVTGTSNRIPGAVFSLYKKTLSGNVLVSQQTTDANGNIVWDNLQAGAYELVEDSAPAGYGIITKTRNVTISEGENEVLVVYNNGPTPTPTTPPTENPEATPTPSPSPTPTPEPTPTASPIESDELIIEDVDPAFGPETGEGDALFITIGLLLLIGAGLFVIRKKVLIKNK